ncbi:hypothetical protein KAM344_28260 [Aeromonas caviae]|nr:hypothetical protein KAM344_28260 [Aeromonas caviae]
MGGYIVPDPWSMFRCAGPGAFSPLGTAGIQSHGFTIGSAITRESRVTEHCSPSLPRPDRLHPGDDVARQGKHEGKPALCKKVRGCTDDAPEGRVCATGILPLPYH